MNPKYALQVCSTGETILEQETDKKMYVWHKLHCRRVLKSKKRAERYQEAIRNYDVVVAWVNYDEMQRSMPRKDFLRVCDNVFKNYEKFYEEWLAERDTQDD